MLMNTAKGVTTSPDLNTPGSVLQAFATPGDAQCHPDFILSLKEITES